jgi:hypothetical protein
MKMGKMMEGKKREKWSRLNEWMVIFIGKGGREK